MEKKIRVLMAKAGLDGHQGGIRIVSRGMRDAGMEVVFLGLYNTVDKIVEAALQEDVDVIGISSLSGGHRTFIPRLTELMKKKGLEDVLLVVGGVIPDRDIADLLKTGVARVFKSGSALSDITGFIKKAVA